MNDLNCSSLTENCQVGTCDNLHNWPSAATNVALFFVDIVSVLVADALITMFALQPVGIHPHASNEAPIFFIGAILCVWFFSRGHYTARNAFSKEAVQVVIGLAIAAYADWQIIGADRSSYLGVA